MYALESMAKDFRSFSQHGDHEPEMDKVDISLCPFLLTVVDQE